jgi:hypothetical protein
MMTRVRAFATAFILLIVGILCLTQTHAQMGSLTGADGPFTRTSRGGGYQGPLDCTGCPSAGSYLAYYDLHCSTSTYTGNVARIRSPSDALTTTITCSTGGVLGTTGTALATTCAVSCTVDILYDQIAGSCGDAVQTTEANRPLYILNADNSLPAMKNTGSTSVELVTGSCSAISQPFMATFVGERITYAGGADDTFANGGSEWGYDNSPNKAYMYAGGANVPNATANDGSFHFVQYTNNTTTSEIYVDGSGTSINNLGGNGLSGAITMIGGFSAGTNPIYIRSIGIGVDNATFSGGQKTALDTNVRTYWGF